MPLYLSKRLYLYRGDFTEIGWFRDGRVVPSPALPDTVTKRWLAQDQWGKGFATPPTNPAQVAERYRDGGRCFVIHGKKDGTLLYHLWVSPKGAWIDWINARVTPPPGIGLVFDVWAHPDWRDGTLHLIGASQACNAIRDLGLQGMSAGVEAHEVMPFARMYARAGFGLIAPYEVLVWRRLAGYSWHRRELPPARFEKSCAVLRRRYEKGLST